MKYIHIAAPGGPEVLELRETAVPEPRAGQVLIRVAAAGVNRLDILQRMGAYPPPAGASDIPGVEVAGEIVKMKGKIDHLKVGDRVCALLTGGGYAEYTLADAGACLPIPAGLSDIEAAGLPESFFTVWSNVFDRGGLKSGESFLVHGGSSGIGTTAIQLARAFGATVFTTVGSEDKRQACLALGADHVINYREQDFVEYCQQATGKHGINLILDMVGGPYLPRNIKALADDGRLVQIAFLQGAKVEANFAEIMTRRLTFTGSTLRPQSDQAKARIAAEVEAHVWPMIARGALRVVIDSEFPLTEAAAAHWRIEAPGHIGKIVLKVRE